MLTTGKAAADEREQGQPAQPAPDLASPGARSDGDPTVGGSGLMEPLGVGGFTW